MVARFDDSKDDRRLENRVRLSTAVTVESGGLRYAGKSCDLSRGGIFVATDHMVAVGEDVRLTIELPNGSLSVEGTVRGQRDIEAQDDGIPGLGIAFTRLQPSDLRILGAVCDEREPYFYDFDR